MRASSAARAVVLVLLLAVAAWWLTPAVPWLDDAFISLDSAQSVLAGADPQYGSPPLAGVTSPPYVLLLSLLLTLGAEPLVAVRIAGAAGLAALALSLWALGRSTGLSGWREFVLPVGVLAAGQAVDQATNGVETGWAMATVAALILPGLTTRPVGTMPITDTGTNAAGS